MSRRVCRLLCAALSIAIGLASGSRADDWGTFAAISSTMGVHDGRVCVGESTRRDIGCPIYAPVVGTDGSISATGFVGDGSGLTGVIAGSSDRIVSGTTSMLAVSRTGFVSLTQAGTNTGWFDPNRGLVTLGVSTTGAISGTIGYFNGNIIGTGDLTLGSAGNDGDIRLYDQSGNPRVAMDPQNGHSYINAPAAYNFGLKTADPSQTLHVAGSALISSWTGINFSSGSKVTPTAPLEVSGTISATIIRTPQLRIVRPSDNGGTSYLDMYEKSGSEHILRILNGNSTNAQVGINLNDGNGTVERFNFHPRQGLRGIDTGGIERFRLHDASASFIMPVSGLALGINLATPTTALEVSGTVSATNFNGKFVGDGSSLTGVIAGSSDRIVSGTTSMHAVSTTGFVSLTQAGTNTGWFDPTRGLVTLGVSSTGRISAVELTVRGSIDIVMGTGNVLIGQYAGDSNTGISVTAIGQYAGEFNSNDYVTVIGNGTGLQNSGTRLTAVGANAGNYNIGDYVTAVGLAAAAGNSASYVTALGAYAAQYSGGSGNLVAVGRQAGKYNSGSDVVLIGNNAGSTNIGTNVVGLGNIAVQNNIGSGVVALGQQAAMSNKGSYVHAIGVQAAQYNSGTYVEAVGYRAARNNSGSDVIAFGRDAAYNNIYSNVIALGYDAASDKKNQVILGGPTIVEVTTTGVILARGVSTTGVISATRFVGDGSGLTNLQGASADRIVSGTTSMLAVSSTGFVSLTQAGTNTGWFDPNRGLVTLGISATGPISGTRGSFNAGVEVSGTMSATLVKVADVPNLPCTPERYGTIRYENGRSAMCMPR